MQKEDINDYQNNFLEKYQFIFIIGSPRSGTTWLRTMLNSHPKVAGVNSELTIFARYILPIQQVFDEENYYIKNNLRTQGLPSVWSENEMDRFVQDFLTKVYAKLIERKKEATHILDKHPGNSNHVNMIRKHIPNAKFIHVLRDGREVAVSMMSVHKRRGFGFGDIFGATLDWKRHVINSQKGADLGVEKYIEIRYEDLRKNGNETLNKLFQFCNLNTDENVIDKIIEENDISVKTFARGNKLLNENRDKKGYIWKHKMSASQRFMFGFLAGELLREKKYVETKTWWITSPLDIFIVFFTFPFLLLKLMFIYIKFIFNYINKNASIFLNK